MAYGKLENLLKSESSFARYETMQHNKCIVCMKPIMSQFLSTLEERKWVVGCALLPENSISHVL